MRHKPVFLLSYLGIAVVIIFKYGFQRFPSLVLLLIPPECCYYICCCGITMAFVTTQIDRRSGIFNLYSWLADLCLVLKIAKKEWESRGSGGRR